MREIRDELEACLKQLELFQENFNTVRAGDVEKHLYCHNRKGKASFSVATSRGGFHSPDRKSINNDRAMMRELLLIKVSELAANHVSKDIDCIKKALEEFEEFDLGRIMAELPRAYRALPDDVLKNLHNGWYGLVPDCRKDSSGWSRTDSGIIIPERLKEAARKGTLTSKQKEEIREIQREWANQPYEQNTKNLAGRNKVTSHGLLVRSKSEVSLAEMIYKYDIPFRYDEVIVAGNRTVSPDFSFLSILAGRVCWEHAGMTNMKSYIDHHRYKRGIYESIGLVPWKNYIETYDEEDGSIDMRIVDAEIRNKLLKWLFLD